MYFKGNRVGALGGLPHVQPRNVCVCVWMCMSMCKHTSVHDHVRAFAGVRWGTNL